MVTNFDIWKWLADNSEALTTIVSIVAIGFAVYVAKKSPKWEFEAQYKLSMIKDEFPSLLSDIRGTLSDFKDFMKGGSRFNIFPKLREMKKAGKLEHVYRIDKTLYDNLNIVLKDVIPLLEKLVLEKGELFIKVRGQWDDYLKSLETTTVHSGEYSDRLWNLGQHYLWREEKAEFLLQSKLTSNYVTERIKQVIPPNSSEFNALYEIGMNEVTFVKRNIDKINKMIENTIENKIIKSIEEHIRNPF